MDYLIVYEKICRILIQYTPVNNANMFTISNSKDKGKIGIKKKGEVIVVLCLYGDVNKNVPPSDRGGQVSVSRWHEDASRTA